jgi:hypothetical protein
MCIAPSDILYVDRYLSHEAHAELSARVTRETRQKIRPDQRDAQASRKLGSLDSLPTPF